MKIGRQFNTFSIQEYQFYIDNHKKYTDFNTLGLYRSIIENEKLGVNEKIEIRNYAHHFFQKTFDFLQLKDPEVFIAISTLGRELTKGDEEQLWENVRKNQQNILTDKRIKHRNFGDYSKHNCGHETCIWNGVMIKQGSWLMERNMDFSTDRNDYSGKIKSNDRKVDRRREKEIINRELDHN